MSARRLRYTLQARADLNDIRAYLREAAGGPAAARMTERIRNRIKSAREFPEVGVPRPDMRANCRFVLETPYVIYYNYRGGEMVVLRILHAARDRDAIMRGDVE